MYRYKHRRLCIGSLKYVLPGPHCANDRTPIGNVTPIWAHTGVQCCLIISPLIWLICKASLTLPNLTKPYLTHNNHIGQLIWQRLVLGVAKPCRHYQSKWIKEVYSPKLLEPTSPRCRVMVLVINFTVFAFVMVSNNKKVCTISERYVASIV